MIRTLGVLAIASSAIAVAALGGRVGGVDLASVPLPLIICTAISGLLLLGLRSI